MNPADSNRRTAIILFVLFTVMFIGSVIYIQIAN